MVTNLQQKHWPKHVAKIMDSQYTWMDRLSGKSTFEWVENSFAFNRCLRQGSVEAQRLWKKMATQILANVEEEWMKKRKGALMDVEGGGEHKFCSLDDCEKRAKLARLQVQFHPTEH